MKRGTVIAIIICALLVSMGTYAKVTSSNSSNKSKVNEATIKALEKSRKREIKDYVCTAEKKATCEYTVDYSNKIPDHEYIVAVRIYKYVDYNENAKNLLKYLGTVYKYFTPENTYGTLTVEFDVEAIPSERYYAKGEIFDTQLQELYK